MARMVLGLTVCLLVLRLAGIPLRWHRTARRAYLVAGLGIYGAMTAVYWSSRFIPSGWIAVLFGLSPLVTSLMAVFWLGEGSLSVTRVFSLLTAVGGLAVMFGSGATLGDDALYGIFAVLVSVLIHSASAIWVRRIGAGLPALSVTAGGLSVSVPLFLLTWFLVDGSWPPLLSARARFAIAYLGLFGSVLGFVWYFYLLKRLEAVHVNLLTLVTPFSALLLGSWVNGERLTGEVWTGASLIVAGLVFYQFDIIGRRRAEFSEDG
jgi:drug/metabolite transporter (DMT)-like permease